MPVKRRLNYAPRVKKVGSSSLFVALALAGGLLLPSNARADGAVEEARKDIEKTGAWEAGVRLHYVTASPVMPIFYDRYKDVSGYTVGGVLTRRSPHGTRLVFGLDYTSVNPKDGPWLEAGEERPSSEWTEFRDFSIVSVNAIIGKEWGEGRTFGFFAGGGLGLDVVSGSITSYPTAPPNYSTKAPGGAPDEKDVPSIVPTVLFRLGPTVSLAGKGSLSFDVGIHNGFFLGTTIGARF